MIASTCIRRERPKQANLSLSLRVRLSDMFWSNMEPSQEHGIIGLNVQNDKLLKSLFFKSYLGFSTQLEQQKAYQGTRFE